MSHSKCLTALLALQVCSSCATSDVPKPQEEDVAAVRAQMEVKAALLDADEVAAAPIRVEYESGRVRLTGYVETDAEKQRAAEVAKRAVPDVEVMNGLRIWRPSQGAVAPLSEPLDRPSSARRCRATRRGQAESGTPARAGQAGNHRNLPLVRLIGRHSAPCSASISNGSSPK